MYFDLPGVGAVRLFDGDKIAALLAGFTRELLAASGLGALRLLAVQTAYANGASTGCIRAAGAEARSVHAPAEAACVALRPAEGCAGARARGGSRFPRCWALVILRICLSSWLASQVALAKTGVKHLHAVAERAEIGCYFEANGHGTLLFSPTALAAIRSVR